MCGSLDVALHYIRISLSWSQWTASENTEGRVLSLLRYNVNDTNVHPASDKLQIINISVSIIHSVLFKLFKKWAKFTKIKAFCLFRSIAIIHKGKIFLFILSNTYCRTWLLLCNHHWRTNKTEQISKVAVLKVWVCGSDCQMIIPSHELPKSEKVNKAGLKFASILLRWISPFSLRVSEKYSFSKL